MAFTIYFLDAFFLKVNIENLFGLVLNKNEVPILAFFVFSLVIKAGIVSEAS